jgi:hypothetical protein
MDEVNKDTIRFSLAETMDDLRMQIAEVLPVIKTEWVMLKEEDTNKPYFTTTIGRVNIEVHETHAHFTLAYKSSAQESRTYENTKKVGTVKKRLKLNMYGALVKRFADNNEYSFYKRVLRTLNGQVNIQKERNEVTFTEDADS